MRILTDYILFAYPDHRQDNHPQNVHDYHLQLHLHRFCHLLNANLHNQAITLTYLSKFLQLFV